jgi:hypothetical protein
VRHRGACGVTQRSVGSSGLTLLHVGGGDHLEVGRLGALLHAHALAHQGGAGQTKNSGRHGWLMG